MEKAMLDDPTEFQKVVEKVINVRSLHLLIIATHALLEHDAGEKSG